MPAADRDNNARPRVSAGDLLATDSLLTAEERAIRDRVRLFCDEYVRPYVAEWFETATLPARDLARALGELGVLGMRIEGHGCAGLGAVAYGLACQELEAADSGVRSLVSVQGSLAMHAIAAYGSDEQRAEWLPAMARGEVIGCFGLTEADFGSNPAGMRTRARRAPGGDWVLDGTKLWITNGTVARVAIVWARTDDGVQGFAVPADTPGFTATEITRKLSLRASATAELVLDGVRLPAGAALPGARGLGSALACLNEARQGIVFGAVGAARDCLETAIAYARDRQVFDKPLATYQLTQAKIADMAVDLGRDALLAIHLGRLAEAGTLQPYQVSAGKLTTVRDAIAIARQCRTILGANGVSLEYPVIRHAANLESVLTYEGTSEVHQLVVGEALTGYGAFR